jgi:type II secretory pathway pseudopilin PulG
MNFPSLRPRPSSRAAFSLVEALLVVGVLALISTMSVLAWNKVNQNVQHQKVETDVRTVNAAISMYVAGGGNLGAVVDADGVLARLKSSRSKDQRRQHAGAASGRLIDPRIAAVSVPESSWKHRAVFNPATQRFSVATSGSGVEFVLDTSLAEVPATIEDRDLGAVKYASTSGWVWDHASTANPSAPGGPSTFATNPTVPDSSPVDPTPDPEPDPGPGGGGPPDPGPPPPPPLPRLPTPQFDVSGGAHAEDKFPLTVAITNVPAAAEADAIYQLGNGTWTPYSGPVQVPMNSWLRAQFVSKIPAAYQDSSEHSAYYYPVPESLSGKVEGDFHSPTGGPNLDYKITNGHDRFEHGDPVFLLDGKPVNSGDPNVLAFSSQAFSNVAPGQKFKLGDFFYHNGSTYYDSHATGVLLRVTIDLPERSQTLAFNLDLDLVNTENDPDDANASADYVVITNLTQDIPLQINGVNYRIQLEFGATDSFGFSSQSQFHVYEGATGQGELLGTFLPR